MNQDYESEKAALKRQFEQDHMVKWIVNSVTKSITPQQVSIVLPL